MVGLHQRPQQSLSSLPLSVFMHERVQHCNLAWRRLVTEALTRGSKDNITVVVAFLQHVDTVERIFADGRHKHTAAATHYGTRSLASEWASLLEDAR